MKTGTLLKSEGEWAGIAHATGNFDAEEIVEKRVEAIISAIKLAGGQAKHARNVYEHHRRRKIIEITAAAYATE